MMNDDEMMFNPKKRKDVRHKRSKGRESIFVSKPISMSEVPTTPRQILQPFFDAAVRALVKHGKINNEDMEEIIGGDVRKVFALGSKIDPVSCWAAREIIMTIYDLGEMGVLDSEGTDTFKLCRLATLFYQFGVSVFEDYTAVGMTRAAGSNEGNKRKVEASLLFKDKAQKFANDVWAKEPNLKKGEVAQKIQKELNRYCYSQSIGKGEYAVSYIERIIKRKDF
ncbi:hypothetical protein [Vibrio sp. S12_S33]|uniref:hypothetical protein n=1 Tax=Vibrio sp. S12_S33 TaxID=2720223 RepID=UPI001784E3EE|nr:hypothetical protein [Vibrio sp. S12_S33]MBD1567134.1 hypothetical protein [Vibrio sp. S12_S33]